MATAVLRVVRSIRGKALREERAAISDRALLECFADGADEEAFAELVRRHGPLVLGVCQRVLGNVQDAEDAFQATFLVLARKAQRVAWRESVKNWLHGVAYRVAMKARGKAFRRLQKEKAATEARPAQAPADSWNDMKSVLDQEIERLPAKYRDVLILCYLEGKTRDEAAEWLGWSLGAVKGCLERGRELLRSRLCQRGLTLSAALCAGLLSDAAATAAPVALQSATVHASVAFVLGAHGSVAAPVYHLAQGALQAMLMSKIKAIGFTMMMLVFGAGATIGVYQSELGGGSFNVTPVSHAQEAQRRDGDQNKERGKDEQKKRSDFFGIVKTVDLKVGTVTVQGLRDGDAGDVTFSLGAKDLKVESTFGQPLKLADLAVGQRVHLKLKDTDVMSIQVEHPNVPAFLTNIDAEKRIIQARAERMNAQYEVAGDAKLTINGQAVKLADVPLETRIFLTLTFDKKTVLAMNANKVALRREQPGAEKPKGDRPAEGRPVEGRPVERAPNMVDATIIGVDIEKNSLKLLVNRGGELAIEDVAVIKDLKARVRFAEKSIQEIAIAQLTKPLQVQVQWSEDRKSITALTVIPPTIRAGVKSHDAAARKITLILPERVEKTFDLDGDVVIRPIGREGAKAALEPGTAVIVALSLDRTRVIGITTAPVTRREGDR